MKYSIFLEKTKKNQVSIDINKNQEMTGNQRRTEALCSIRSLFKKFHITDFDMSVGNVRQK